jgi:molybdopterin-guanine dinucleotide biosynthesis protein A
MAHAIHQQLGAGPIPEATQGVILAGGEASRYGGRPKGLELVGGRRVLDRLTDAFVEALGESPLLVANAPEAPGWRPDLRVVPDVRPGLGALGGIYTAVVTAPAPLVLVAWDMPFVTPALIRELASGLSECDVFLPESDGHPGCQPLCAAYGPGCTRAIEASLDRGDLRAIGFHQEVNAGILPLARVRTLGDPAQLFFNLNTPDDLAEANALWQQGLSRS